MNDVGFFSDDLASVLFNYLFQGSWEGMVYPHILHFSDIMPKKFYLSDFGEQL